MISLGPPFVEIVAASRRSGVYLLVAAEEIVYVGQSVDLDGRVATHRAAMNGLRGMKFDRAFVLNVPEEELDAYEGALIRAFNPRFNNAAPCNRGRDAEVLARLGIPEDLDRTFEIRRHNWFSKTIRRTQRASRAQSRRWAEARLQREADLEAEIALIEGRTS